MTTYNETGHHEATATGVIDGEEYSVTCNGLSTCGESSCEPCNPFDRWTLSDGTTTDNEMESIGDDDSVQNPDWLAFEALRSEAVDRVRKEWNYDGSNWSEPVDDPDISPADEPIDGGVAVVRTRFHGGGIVGYFASRDDAQAWIDYSHQNNTCTCGCVGIVENDDIDDLAQSDSNGSPYDLTN